MLINHVALYCTSEKKSDKFYQKLLNLEKTHSKTISSSLSKKIFNIDMAFKLVNYAKDNTRFEIFISDDKKFSPRNINNRVEHVCIIVDDMESFLDKCKSFDIDINKIPVNDYFIIFIKDYDGNLFEVKDKL